MERNFYSENFENFLKGHADKFKMTPSKKVWHGIYNDLHPGTRWPSVAMSIVFIFTLVIIGHLNTNNGHNTPLHNVTSLPATSHHTSNLVQHKKTSHPAKHSYTQGIINGDNSTTANTGDNDPNTNQLSVIKSIQPSSNTIISLPNINEKNNNAVSENKNEIPIIIENSVTKTSSLNNDVTKSSQHLNDIMNEERSENTTSNINKEINPTIKEPAKKLQPQANGDNIRKPSRISNVTWTYYLSPSFSYRYLSDDVNNFVVHKPRIGYEAGTEMSFKIYKKLSFTTGLQLNFSGYKIRANNAHPIMATLTLNGETPGQNSIYYSISHYSNSTASDFTRLKNYSFQASLPIGLQYVLAENDNIKFSAAATFQPSVIIAKQAYLLSSDKKNYLKASDLLRNWNMNTSFTTYVSFSSNSLNWQIGPQVRYQLLSTYSNRYQNKEHLVNYGFRIGISKSTK